MGGQNKNHQNSSKHVDLPTDLSCQPPSMEEIAAIKAMAESKVPALFRPGPAGLIMWFGGALAAIVSATDFYSTVHISQAAGFGLAAILFVSVLLFVRFVRAGVLAGERADQSRWVSQLSESQIRSLSKAGSCGSLPPEAVDYIQRMKAAGRDMITFGEGKMIILAQEQWEGRLAQNEGKAKVVAMINNCAQAEGN